MSSPIHKYLFSPPPSPPHRAADSSKPSSRDTFSPRLSSPNPRLTSIKSLFIPEDLVILPRASTDSVGLLGSAELVSSHTELKSRSPRTPQNGFAPTFTPLDSGSQSQSHSPPPAQPRVYVEDVEAFPRSQILLSSPAIGSVPSTPKRRTVSDKLAASPSFLSTPTMPMPNIASHSSQVSISLGIPRPLVRLLFLTMVITSSLLILILVPAARLPSLRAASVSRRLALDTDGAAFLDIQNPINGWQDARDRDYVPPQVRPAHMLKRDGYKFMEEAPVDTATASRTTLLALTPRPLPSSHELLALQAYLLQNAFQTLPEITDPSAPLDALSILGVGASELGTVGSPQESAYFASLESEWKEEVVLWFGSHGVDKHPHEILALLESIHGKEKQPTLLPCHARPDRMLLNSILSRLGFAPENPVLMIGNQAIEVTESKFEELKNGSELKDLLNAIGWSKKDEPEKVKKPLKMAKWVKRQETEVEMAERAMKQARFLD